MKELYTPTTINRIKARYDFKVSKSLGQNFLTDINIIEKIVDATNVADEDLVIEIGPGMGVLTAVAAERAKKVIAIELDRNLIPILKDNLAEYDNVEIINQDILKTDLNSLIDRTKYKGVKILGNLPYYITTPIIMKILEEGVDADSITAMMQKEVADRIKSGPSKKTRGAISVAVQYYCEVVDVASVPKEVFMPQPKVDSAVLRFDIREKKPVELLSEKTFFACVKAGFGQRRKTLSNSLMGMGDISKEDVLACLEASGIDGSRRAETLTIEEFAALSNEIYKRG